MWHPGQPRGAERQADRHRRSLRSRDEDLGAAAADVDHHLLARHGPALLDPEKGEQRLLLVAERHDLDAGGRARPR